MQGKEAVTTSFVLALYAKYKKKTPNDDKNGRLLRDLEAALGEEATISKKALMERCKRLYTYVYTKGGVQSRSELRQTVQGGLLRTEVPWRLGHGYIARPTTPPMEEFLAATPNLPSHLREVTGDERRRLLLDHVSQKVSGVENIRILVVMRKVRFLHKLSKATAESFRGKIPHGSFELQGNFALFEARNGGMVLTAVVVEKNGSSEEACDGLSSAIKVMLEKTENEVAWESRGENMYCWGVRHSPEHGTLPHWFGRRARKKTKGKKKVQTGEEAVMSILMEEAEQLLLARCFSPTLYRQMVEMRSYWPSMFWFGPLPYTTVAVTWNYNNKPHLDLWDVGESLLFWLHHGKVHDGAFVLPEYGVHFGLHHSTVMWLCTKSVWHYSVKQEVEDCANNGIIGVALLSKSNVLSSGKSWLRKFGQAGEEEAYLEARKQGIVVCNSDIENDSEEEWDKVAEIKPYLQKHTRKFKR